MDLVFAEDDWVRREFDELVEAGWGGSRPTCPRTRQGAHGPRRSGPRSRLTTRPSAGTGERARPVADAVAGPALVRGAHSPGRSPIKPCTRSYVARSAAATSPRGMPRCGRYGLAVEGADEAAGLGQQQRARGVVPRLGLAVERVVGLALDQLGVVDTAAHPGQVELLEGAERPADPPPPGGHAPQLLVDRRPDQPLTVAVGAGPALGDVRRLVLRLPDPRPHHLATADLGRHDRVVAASPSRSSSCRRPGPR